MSKKIVQGIFRFLSMIFKYLKEGISKKIVPGIFEIRKYDFLNTSKSGRAKILSQVFSDL